MRVCDAACEVLRKTGNPAVMWGDEGLLHAIAERLGWKHECTKTSDRVLAAIRRTPGDLIPVRTRGHRNRLTHRYVLPEHAGLKTLRLTLKKHWFDMIASGEKREEYREPSRWILSRLEGKQYDRVEFKNGYGDVPAMTVEYLGWSYGVGRPEWGGHGARLVVIYIGKVLSGPTS